LRQLVCLFIDPVLWIAPAIGRGAKAAPTLSGFIRTARLMMNAAIPLAPLKYLSSFAGGSIEVRSASFADERC